MNKTLTSNRQETFSNSPIIAGGGILWRKTLLGPRLAVIHRKRYGGDCCLPKGKAHGGETARQTALREVREETGWEVEITGFAGTICYQVKGIPKTVKFWHMEAIGKVDKPDTEEVHDVVWLSPRKALSCLDYPLERGILSMAILKRRQYIFSGLGCQLSPRRKRLLSAVTCFKAEIESLENSGLSNESNRNWIYKTNLLLGEASIALLQGQLDTAWKCFLSATRMQILGLSEAERQARVTTLREEALDKLKGWRQKAVLAILDSSTATVDHNSPYDINSDNENVTKAKKQQEETPENCSLQKRTPEVRQNDANDKQHANVSAEKVFYATFLRDEAFCNQYFKISYLNHQRVLLLSVMLCALLLALTISQPVWFDVSGNSLPTSTRFQIGVVLLGIVGGAFSAIMSLSRSSTDKRIPQQIMDSWITVLRPAMGAAGAFVVYLFCIGGSFDFIEVSSAPIMMAIAFCAGFSERLIVSRVESVTKK